MVDKGFVFQECKTPCKTMNVESRIIRSFDSYGDNTIQIIFDPSVRVTQSEPTMPLLTLFSNIGGCLGLTLGYSLLHLGEKIQLVMHTSSEAIRRRMP